MSLLLVIGRNIFIWSSFDSKEPAIQLTKVQTIYFLEHIWVTSSKQEIISMTTIFLFQ